jgi:[ribosomal protein S5]-alanine N-acetyltransferase
MNDDQKGYILETNRLILRPFLLSDAEKVSVYCNNIRLAKSTLSLPYPYPIESAINWINMHQDWFFQDIRYEFAITLKETGELVGAVGLGNNKVWKNGEIGYWIGEEHWDCGYATEAVTKVIEWAFKKQHFHRVYARHFESNPASGKVMMKSGMIYEGKQLDHILKNGIYEHVVLYGIINPE